MADMVAVMHEGRLQQLAAPADLYAHPVNLFVARFCGSPPMNVLAGDVTDGVVRAPVRASAAGRAGHSGPVRLGFRPEHATMVEPGMAGSLAGEVYVVEPLGNETLLALQTRRRPVNLRAAAGFNPAVGSTCGVLPVPHHLHLFDAETGVAIGSGNQCRPTGAKP